MTPSTPFEYLRVSNPVLAAPMSGGPSSPALVEAAFSAGSLGFLAAGYKTAEELAEQIATLRSRSVPFGVNLFVPNVVPVDRDEFRRYAELVQPEADRYGLDLTGATPVEDDDFWQAKIDLLTSNPVPVVGFTFGMPSRAVIDALHRAGSTLVQTVTSVQEARMAADSGIDILTVQSFEAGGHWGTLTPQQPPPTIRLVDLVRRVRSTVALPLLAAGGIATAAGAAAVLAAGAAGVLVGTVLLGTEESSASPLQKAALLGTGGPQTVVTKAFTGRPARALPNLFTDRYDTLAPSGYPAIHHLTSPIRRAATAAQDPDRVNLWAGTGHAHARSESARVTLARLAELT